MSRAFAFGGVVLAGACGVLITYATLRPELEKRNAEQKGQFVTQHTEGDDKAVSRAIASDFREAREQLRPNPNSGFAWGIRQAIFGKPDQQSSDEKVTVELPVRGDEEMKESPREVVEKAQKTSEKGG